MPGFNAAQRVLAVLQRAQALDERLAFTKAMTEMFGETPEGHEGMRLHAKRLEAIHRQVDEVESELKSLSFPAQLYERHVNRVRNAFSPQHLQSGWAVVRKAVAAEVVVCFEWASFALEDEGSVLEDMQLHELCDAVRALLAQDALGRLPSKIREDLRRVLEELLLAAQLAGIAGPEAVYRAVRNLAVEIDSEVDVLQTRVAIDPDGRSLAKAFAHLGGAIGKLWNSTATHAERFEKIGKAFDRCRQTLKWASDMFDKLPPPSPG